MAMSESFPPLADETPANGVISGGGGNRTRATFPPLEAWTAWAAGLFEGEGCITAERRSGNRKMRLVLSVSSTDHDVLERFHAVVAAGKIFGPYQRGHLKPHWIWHCSQLPDVERICDLLRPFLGQRRCEAIDRASQQKRNADAAWRPLRRSRVLLIHGQLPMADSDHSAHAGGCGS